MTSQAIPHVTAPRSSNLRRPLVTLALTACALLAAALAAPPSLAERRSTAITTAPVAPPATAPAERRWELLFHGGGDHLWYAITTPPGYAGPPHALLRTRAVQGEWTDLPPVANRVLALGGGRGQLLASLDGGEWKRISAGEFLSGPPLPGHGNVLAIASDADAMWAIGLPAGAAAAGSTTTNPASALENLPLPARAASLPVAPPSSRPVATTNRIAATTRAATGLPHLYRFTGSTWADVIPLPDRAATPPRACEISMLIVAGVPVVAFKRADGNVAVARLANGAGGPSWTDAGTMRAGEPARKVSLLSVDDKLVGWTAGRAGLGTFFFPPDTAGPADWSPRPVASAANVPVMDVAVAALNGDLRLLVIRPDERFFEARYDRAGNERIGFKEVGQPAPRIQWTAMDLLYYGLLGLLVVFTLVTANRNGVAGASRGLRVATIGSAKIAIAPLPLRLAAGVIDLWPIYASAAVVSAHWAAGGKPSQLVFDTFAEWAGLAAVAVYFLHTLVGELIWGRSIGKMFVGLRVVTLRDTRPPVSAILLRNLMRVIEVLPALGIPLFVILFNPLHQRLGDFFAGTVVTTKLPKREPRDEEGEE